jgi:hypothetical protein
MKELAVAMLILGLGASMAQAQDEAQETEAAPAAETSENAAETTEAPPARAEETQTESRRGRPQKFEPSEEISEDLSVSFPVDI